MTQRKRTRIQGWKGDNFLTSSRFGYWRDVSSLVKWAEKKGWKEIQVFHERMEDLGFSSYQKEIYPRQGSERSYPIY